MRMRRPSIENGRFRPLSFTPAPSCGPGVGLARDWVAQARALVAPIVLTLWSVTSLTAAILSSRAGLSYLFTLRFLALVITMAGSSLESSAVFEARAIELGVLPSELERMRSFVWNKFGGFAFACSYMPGTADYSALVRLARTLTDTPADGEVPLDRMSVIRRVFFESYTLASADVHARVERRDDDPPRRMAVQERAARHQAQQRRLLGLHLRGELEPSHYLVDFVQDLFEANELKYVRWEQCAKRDQDIMGVRLDPI